MNGILKRMPEPLTYRKPSVTLVIPTLNEAKNLPLVLPYIPLDVVNEVVLVDGRSTDNTVEVARQLLPSIKVVMEKTPGKGAALRRGYKESSGEIIIVIDADGSHDPREIPRFIRALMEGADFVKGSRFVPLGGTTDMPRLRKLGNYGFVKMVNVLFSQAFTDLCYGFHAFWRYSLDFIDLSRVDGFEIDTAIYLQAVRAKLKVIDVPSFEGFRFYGVGKLQTFPDGWRVLRTIVREWMEDIKQPASEPQVGFRGIEHMPAVNMNSMIPITGSNGNGNGHEHGNVHGKRVALDIPNRNASNMHRVQLDEYFGQRLSMAPNNGNHGSIPRVLLNVFEGLGASSGSFILLDDDMNIRDGYVVYGRRMQPTSNKALTDTFEQGIAGWAARNRTPVLVQSTRNDPRWLRRDWEVRDNDTRSAVVVPFVSGDKVVGVLTLTRPADRSFTEQDLQRLKQMAVSV